MMNASTINKKELCEEIGNFFGTYYEDIAGFLVIDDGETERIYNDEDELLKDWLPTLIESDEATQDDYWVDAIDYIRNYILD